MQNVRPGRALGFGVATAAWTGVLFFFSGQSAEASGGLSRRLTEWLFRGLIERGADVLVLEGMVRKTAHFGVFAVAGFLLAMMFMHLTGRRAAAMLTFLLSAALAVGNELHQLTAEARSCSVTDMLIDTAGAVFGLITAAALLALAGRWRKRNQERNTTGEFI